jgi:hypothetical protein
MACSSTLLGLLILAFGGDNVSVDSGSDLRGSDRQAICRSLTEGGVLTADLDLLRQAARRMLTGVLSCRDNRSQSGPFARVAGETIGASLRLPNMATEAFLSCLSRSALETAATAESVTIAPRAKDTRARVVKQFADSVYVYPGALFKMTEDDLAIDAATARSRYVPGTGLGGGGEDGEDGQNPDGGLDDECEGLPGTDYGTVIAEEPLAAAAD